MIKPEEVNLRPHETTKEVFGKKITKSFGQSYVDMRGDDGVWRHVGWYFHTAKTFSGLVNWDNDLNESMVKAIESKLNEKVSYSVAPQDRPEQVTEASEDEFEG